MSWLTCLGIVSPLFVGVKGKTLSGLVLNIFEQFKEDFEKMSNKKYDPLDPASVVSRVATRFVRLRRLL